MPTRTTTRTRWVHEFYTAEDITLLSDHGNIKFPTNGLVVDVDRLSISTKVAEFLHGDYFVTTPEEFIENGASIEEILGALMDEDLDKLTPEGYQEFHRAVKALFSTRPDSKHVQTALSDLDPASWLIKGSTTRGGTDEAGRRLSGSLMIYAVTNDAYLINLYDVGGRAKKARASARTRHNYDVGLVERIPETAPDVMAASLWTAESYANEAKATHAALTRSMSPPEIENFDAKVEPKLVEYREQERLAIEGPSDS